MRAARSTFVLAFTLAFAILPARAHAQSGFMFGPPDATISVRVGAANPSANDQLFDFFTRELTLERGDFRTVALAADVGIRVTRQFDVLLGIAYDGSTNRSEFRDWVDQDDMPIEQTTSFDRIPLTVGAKYYILPRGRSLSTHTWVPTNVTPFVTAGAGYMFYDLEQHGDFVDHESLEVFRRRFESSGGGATLHVGGGSELWFTPRVGISAEGRYSWASGDLETDFADFGNIDLRGFQITAGLALRF
ncbi:MAG: outer membrane protein [Gemmatimonadota bacterium]